MVFMWDCLKDISTANMTIYLEELRACDCTKKPNPEHAKTSHVGTKEGQP